jgi:hypothetical protein
MKTWSAPVIPICRPATESQAAGAIADLAFDLWVSAAFRGASPEERSGESQEDAGAAKATCSFSGAEKRMIVS